MKVYNVFIKETVDVEIKMKEVLTESGDAEKPQRTVH